jgi:hypothetical protein
MVMMFWTKSHRARFFVLSASQAKKKQEMACLKVKLGLSYGLSRRKDGGRTAATYGGAERRRASIIEKPIALSKIVMKKPIAYAGVVEAKNMKARDACSSVTHHHTKQEEDSPKLQRNGSIKCLRSLLRVSGSGTESLRSLSILSNTILVCSGVKNLFLSGKSGTKSHVARPRTTVRIPSMMKIHCHPFKPPLPLRSWSAYARIALNPPRTMEMR